MVVLMVLAGWVVGGFLVGWAVGSVIAAVTRDDAEMAAWARFVRALEDL